MPREIHLGYAEGTLPVEPFARGRAKGFRRGARAVCEALGYRLEVRESAEPGWVQLVAVAPTARESAGGHRVHLTEGLERYALRPADATLLAARREVGA